MSKETRIAESEVLERKGNKIITLNKEYTIHSFDLLTNEYIVKSDIYEEKL